jgi:hypothetical protein
LRSPPGISFAKTRDELNAAGVRLFGLQLGKPVIAHIHSNVTRQSGGGLTLDTDRQANTQSLDTLTAASGGFTPLENTDSARKVYKLTDERLDLVKRRALQFYKSIQDYYSVSVNGPATASSIELSEDVRAKLPNAMVLFPAKAAGCKG